MSYYLSLHPLVDHFTGVCVVAWPLNESEAGVELFFNRNLPAFMLMMLFSRSLVGIHTKCGEVSIKIRSTPVSLSFEGQAAKYPTVKWSTQRCRK